MSDQFGRQGLLERSRAGAMAAALLLASAAAAQGPGTPGPQATPPSGIRLVLQITVDQLRGDMPFRSAERFGPGGFRYLLEQGTWFDNAHHAHANTETIVGHTTLATGAHPSAHGMVGNVWLDRSRGSLTYNIEDPDHTTVGGQVARDRDTEIDPSMVVARSEGRSPRAILTSTFSDELAIATARKAKIFGVSVKDRGAVPLAGHAGKAFWFSTRSGGFVSSTYYYEKYPEWVERWNAERRADRYAGTTWELLRDQDDYLFGDDDDRPYETDLAGFGRTFPHPYGPRDGKYFYTLLTLSPAGDQLTLEFAKALLETEGLGRDDVTDYLAISFSSTDYVGHVFGPSSLESEDNLLRLDTVLADLFRFVDARVGLDRTLIVLSADHGAAEVTAYLEELGLSAGWLTPGEVDTDPIFDTMRARFGVGRELIEEFYHPYIYLDRALMRERELDPAEVADVLAGELERLPGVAMAVTSADLSAGRIPDTTLVRQVLRNYHRQRSGDLYLVPAPQWIVYHDDDMLAASTHGSPWRYDTHVPIVFAGAGVAPRLVSRRVHTVDVAATLANRLGTRLPSGCAGDPLVEVLGRGP